MKIAQINNPAGIGSIIAELQKREGHMSDVFVFNNTIHRQFGGTKLKYWSPLDRWKLFRALKCYDVWHYHYPYGSLKRGLERRKSDKIYIKHYHGDDLRSKQENDFCLVSTPDLLKYAPNGKWLPNPIDLKEIEKTLEKSRIQENKITKVAHYPYYENYRGFDYYTDALSTLRSEKKCQTIKILHQPHLETLGILATCDIIIGKILPDIGWFGKFELEGMALGKPVIAYVSDELYDRYNPPIYRTTKASFKKDLETLIGDNFERDKLSKEGPKYVKQNHDVESIAKTVMLYYDKRL